VHDLEKEESCLLSQILNRKNYWLCHITQYHIDEPLWVQLVMDNTWLMITTKPTRIAIICNSIREELMINATAIVKIKNGCVIRSKAVSILSRQNEALKVKGAYHKAVQLNISPEEVQSYTPTSQHISPIIKVEQPVLPMFSTEEYHHIKRHPIERHGFTIIVVVMMLVGLVALWMIKGRLWRYCSARISRRPVQRDIQHRREHVETGSSKETGSTGQMEVA
jgi:hypothetical protein